MSRILFAWELGGGTGHLHNIEILARALAQRGHENTFVLRDLATASRIFPPSGSTLLQAPMWNRSSRLPASRNYADMLNRVGYLDAVGLSGLLRAWVELLRLAKPELMIVEHGPTALLAARIAGVRRIAFGTGFMVPPRIDPMPCIQPWQETPSARLAEIDSAVLGRVNQALASLGGAPLGVISDIFDLDDIFLCTFREFDHYTGRTAAEYWGPLDITRSSEEVPWPAGDGARLFVYYRTSYPHFGALMQQLAAFRLPTLVVADDASAAVIKKFSSDTLHIIARHVSLDAVAKTARLAICHAGHGSAMQFLLNGCPLVMFPTVVEQSLVAYRIARTGVGLALSVERGKQPDFASPIQRVLDTPAFGERARNIARDHAGFDPARQVEMIADRCEAVLSPG